MNGIQPNLTGSKISTFSTKFPKKDTGQVTEKLTLIFPNFYTHVFRRDVLWYGDVCPSGSPSVRHSFPHFLLHALTYWVEILYVTFFYKHLIKFEYRQFFFELCPFWNLEYWKYTVFSPFLLHALIYWAEISHTTMFYCTTDQDRVWWICVNLCGSYAPFGT